jgi:16S rRNA (guanine527-N7)-methyltransferase
LFLESIRKKLKLDCKIRNARAESLETRYDIIVARAVAPLERLVKISYNIKEKGSSLIFLKGKNWQKEIAQIKKQWKFNMNIVKNDILIDTSGGVTLVLKNLEKKR